MHRREVGAPHAPFGEFAPAPEPRRSRRPEAKRFGITAPPDNSTYVAAAELRIRMLAFQRRTEEITARNRLTPQRYLLLLLLRAREVEGDVPAIGSLIDPLQMSQSSVTRLVQGAVRAGLVASRVDPRDHRRQHLELTAEGRRRFENVFTELGPERQTLAEALSTTRNPPLHSRRSEA